jgi:hypothetical protein
LQAQFVRNASIQKLGVAHHVAVVESVDTTNNTLRAKPIRSETTWTVKLASGAKIRKAGEEITLADVQVGDKIRVSGVANRNTKVVEAKLVVVLVARGVVKERLKEIKLLEENEPEANSSATITLSAPTSVASGDTILAIAVR